MLPVVFVHGLIGPFSDTRTVSLLRPAVVVNPDLLGYGAEADADPSEITIEAQAEYVRATVDRMAPDSRMHLVGHSVGGVIAASFVHRFPGRIASFVNVEGNFTLADAFWSAQLATKAPSEVNKLLEADRVGPAPRSFQDRISGSSLRWRLSQHHPCPVLLARFLAGPGSHPQPTLPGDVAAARPAGFVVPATAIRLRMALGGTLGTAIRLRMAAGGSCVAGGEGAAVPQCGSAAVVPVVGRDRQVDVFCASIAHTARLTSRCDLETTVGPARWLRDGGVEPTDDRIQSAAEALAYQPAITIQATARAVVEYTGRPAYEQLLREVFEYTRVHLVAGARSRAEWNVPEWALTAASSYTEIPDTGHMVMLEAPDAFGKVLVGLFGGGPRRNQYTG